MKQNDSLRAIIWRDAALHLLDQRCLPHQHTYLALHTAGEVADAIRSMVVRGAPAIGISAAYGVVLAARTAYAQDAANWRTLIQADMQRLAQSRPTAVNLFWALQRMNALFPLLTGNPEAALEAEAGRIHQEDLDANYHMGDLGAAYIPADTAVITHCNAGALATGGYGTALGVVRSAFSAGKLQRVYADETRPWLQGARLTAWELLQDGIPVTLLSDAAAASLLSTGEVSWAIVGSDRIAANGDVANKIGTYGLAIAARYHGVKFMVVAPTSTIDMSLSSGREIPIENRGKEEVLNLNGQAVAAPNADAWNPAFDVTPAALVDVIVTEKGVIEQPNAEKMAALMGA